MTTPPEPPEIFCVKCRVKTGSADAQAVTQKNGRLATKAT